MGNGGGPSACVGIPGFVCVESKGWIGCLWTLGLCLGLLSWHYVFPTSPPSWPFFSENTPAHLILAGISDSMDVNLSKFWERVKDREAWYAAVHGVMKCWTRLSRWTINIYQAPTSSSISRKRFKSLGLNCINTLVTENNCISPSIFLIQIAYTLKQGPRFTYRVLYKHQKSF